ncbi:putative F-box domain-containing protein [Helianthus annuus]|uniref:F-box domain-containing protein n=1 Tax=Helianthus annuus TaxID=4232 RepID=A0A9K3H0A6_HELAN|nr:F-box protein At5g07610-like isoform X1 [Helianthus annuus]XP_035840831.1 F-box protein At5g07610-like isoform X1 [Helianthus annuus]KAF5761696.1 putative F-box domain-containing protein [Helianthus annuus]
MVQTRAKSKKSAEIISSNDDLLTEILLRLPVTSILRFKSVSKHWHSLLTHRHFTQRYDNISKSPSPGLFASYTYHLAPDAYVPFDVESPSTPPFPTLASCFDLPGVKIVQSCNGLLLCSTNRGPKGGRGALKYYVFNPTTKQLALIPPVLGGCRKTIWFMGLAFHQTDCPHYKLVCVLSAVGPDVDLYQIQIYSSDARKWKIAIQSFPASSIFPARPGVYWNGAVYWAPFPDNTNFLYFKMDSEQLQTLPLPVGFICSYFGESRGHLHLIAYNIHQENRLRLNLYEMLSHHSGWFLKYQVQLDALPNAFPDMIRHNGYIFNVIDVVRGEEEEDTFVVLKTPKKIIKCNVHDKSFKQIFDFGEYPYENFHRYIETLSYF